MLEKKTRFSCNRPLNLEALEQSEPYDYLKKVHVYAYRHEPQNVAPKSRSSLRLILGVLQIFVLLYLISLLICFLIGKTTN